MRTRPWPKGARHWSGASRAVWPSPPAEPAPAAFSSCCMATLPRSSGAGPRCAVRISPRRDAAPPGACATWYCKHVRGASGHRFWKLADKLLREVESELSLWCLAELHTGAAELANLAPEGGGLPDVSALDGEINEPRYGKLWG